MDYAYYEQLAKTASDFDTLEELRADIRKHLEYGEELRENTGKLGVPYLVIDGEWIRGYDIGKAFTDEFAKSLFAKLPIN